MGVGGSRIARFYCAMCAMEFGEGSVKKLEEPKSYFLLKSMRNGDVLFNVLYKWSMKIFKNLDQFFWYQKI